MEELRLSKSKLKVKNSNEFETLKKDDGLRRRFILNRCVKQEKPYLDHLQSLINTSDASRFSRNCLAVSS